MTIHQASRTLLKSSPELWAECSEASSLNRHLDGFGEIRITKLEAETVIAWEGEDVRGTVELEPSGWGTRVILTAEGPAADEQGASDRQGSSSPGHPPTQAPPIEQHLVSPAVHARTHFDNNARTGFFTWLRRRVRPATALASQTMAVQEPAVASPSAPVPVPGGPPAAAAALTDALDSLGMAHHRPFSRA